MNALLSTCWLLAAAFFFFYEMRKPRPDYSFFRMAVICATIWAASGNNP